MKKFISINSGICYEVPEEEVDLLDKSQIPLKEFPKHNCKHCNGRGYTNKDKNTDVYILCKCMIDRTEVDLSKYFIESVRLHTAK